MSQINTEKLVSQVSSFNTFAVRAEFVCNDAAFQKAAKQTASDAKVLGRSFGKMWKEGRQAWVRSADAAA